MNKKLQTAMDFLKYYQTEHEDRDFDNTYYMDMDYSKMWWFKYENDNGWVRGYQISWYDDTKRFYFTSFYFNQDVYDYWVSRRSSEKAFLKHFYSKWNECYEEFTKWMEKLNKKENEIYCYACSGCPICYEKFYNEEEENKK